MVQRIYRNVSVMIQLVFPKSLFEAINSTVVPYLLFFKLMSITSSFEIDNFHLGTFVKSDQLPGGGGTRL